MQAWAEQSWMTCNQCSCNTTNMFLSTIMPMKFCKHMILQMMLKCDYDWLLDLIVVGTTFWQPMRWLWFSQEIIQLSPMISSFSFTLDLYIILATCILCTPLFNTPSFFHEVKMVGTLRWSCLRLQSSKVIGFNGKRDSNNNNTIVD